MGFSDFLIYGENKALRGRLDAMRDGGGAVLLCLFSWSFSVKQTINNDKAGNADAEIFVVLMEKPESK